MIEEEEKILFYLEELDNNFSQINRTLKEIDNKIEIIYKKNQNLIENYQPFIRFFSNTKQKQYKKLDQKNDLENLKEELNSLVIMKSSSPKDPFTNTSNDLLNKKIINKYNDKSQCDSSSNVEELKIYSDCYNDDDSSSDLMILI